MTQERDDYMRRQEADHALLRMRDYTQTYGRALRPVTSHISPTMVDYVLDCDNDPCDRMLSDEQVIDYVRTRYFALGRRGLPFDPHGVAAVIWGINRASAKERIFRRMYGG